MYSLSVRASIAFEGRYRSPVTEDFLPLLVVQSWSPLIDGKLFHWKVLEPEKFDELHIVDVGSKASKAYKEAKAEFGEVYTSKEVAPMVQLAEILMKNKGELDGKD